jgi:alpha-D-ribose 1-methylphosphonate 5-triphosphate synthase subunit PhnL
VGAGDPALAGKSFPVIDKGKQTITIYSGRQKILETISVAEEYLSLPPSTWDAGDEVRIYYKQEGKALRFMNVSRTDIFKK